MNRIALSPPSPLATRSPERLLTRAFVLLCLADSRTSPLPASPSTPCRPTSPDPSARTAGAGLAFGAFAVSALVLRPLAGRLSDTRGRRPLLLCGGLLCAAAMFLTAQAGTLAEVVPCACSRALPRRRSSWPRSRRSPISPRPAAWARHSATTPSASTSASPSARPSARRWWRAGASPQPGSAPACWLSGSRDSAQHRETRPVRGPPRHPPA